MTEVKTGEDWPFDEECPQCGEDVHIGAVVLEMHEDKGALKADMYCGTEGIEEIMDGKGCGHSWKWERDE